MRVTGTKLVCERCGMEDFTTQLLCDKQCPDNSDTFIDNAIVRNPGWGIRDGKELCKLCKNEYDRRHAEFFNNMF